ncbi:MAG: iron-containing alcohol dehydrogenase [Endomicrobium sp.]|jgi:alcohol dehydrogenase YqhD (iron-dependent ADH family)|nr:iron-containing alcohol dehydrogenase [Endomicrobium sp.]
MNNFEFYSPTRIIFGEGNQKKIGKYVKRYSSNILLHYGRNSIKNNGLYDETVLSLKEAGVSFTELGGVMPNPRVSLVRQGIKLCKEKNIDFILAVGGGSVIDSAKAIALGVKHSGDVWDFFTKKAVAKDSIPIAVILTIPAAGSESSPNTVITNEEDAMKLSIVHESLRPTFSILNPAFCFTLPKEQFGYGVCDMAAHIFERYFTQTKFTELSDQLCEGTLKTVIDNAYKILKNYNDYNAWAEIMWAGNIAHNGLLGMGRKEDWASHGIEHAISAVYDIPHGAGLSIVFPAWMKYVYRQNIPLFVQFAINVWGVDGSIRNSEETALKGIEETEKFFKSLGLPTRFGDINIKESDIEIMAKKAVAFGSIGSFKELNCEDVTEIYKLAI